MYFNYDDVTPGVKVETKDKFTNEIELACLNKEDHYANDRRKCIELFFDGKQKECSSELIEKIKKL